MRIAEAVAHPGSLIIAYRGIGLLALRQGDLPSALPLLGRALSLCQDVDLPLWAPRVAATLGAAYTLSGRIADAVPLLMQALEQNNATEIADFQGFCRLSLGEAHLAADRLEEAQALAEHTLALARAHQERAIQPTRSGSSATLRRVTSHQRATRPKFTTSKPSPWATSSACARSGPLPPRFRHAIREDETTRAGACQFIDRH